MLLKLKHIPPGRLVKNILLILMTLLLFFHSELHWIVFKSFEYQYKKEVKQLIKKGIPETELIKFVFHKNIYSVSSSDFRWVKEGEFRYKGFMYDIIRAEVKSDSVYFYCYKDLKESGLFAKLDDLLRSHMDKNPDKQKELLTVLTSINSFYTLSSVPSVNVCAPDRYAYNDIYSFFIPEEFSRHRYPPPKS